MRGVITSMASTYLMGIDIGSYESKGVLTDCAGQVIAQHVTKHKLEFVKPGHVEHDAEHTWWGEFCEISRALIATAGIDATSVAGVGVSAIFSMLPVDAHGDPARRGGILYGIDTRSHAEIAQINAAFGADAIFEAAGNSLSSQSMGPKIRWLKDNEPETYQKTRYFLPAAAFIVGRLTGRFVMSHFDAAFYAPLYDLEKQRWNRRFCDSIVDFDRLADLQWSSEVAGQVTERGGIASGLAVGTPVTVGTSDVAAEALSIGITEPGQMMLMYGSTAWMTLLVDRPLKSRELWSSPFLFSGTFCLHAGMTNSGSLTRWLRDVAARDIPDDTPGSGDDAYTVLSQEAAAVPPCSDDLIVLPYFGGAATPVHDPAAQGVIFGLKLTHTRGHLYRAAMEGVGYSIAHSLEAMTSAGAAATEMVAVGGGVKNPAWLQAVSDITNVPQVVPAVAFGASFGDAFLAGLISGVIKSRTEINNWVKTIKKVDPHQDRQQLYHKKFNIYRQLYNNTRYLMYENSS